MDKLTLIFFNRKSIRLCFFFMFVLLCCTLQTSQTFAQGKLVAKPAGSTSAPWGYYEYLPTNYTQKQVHPVLIFLSGTGEQGNGTSELSKVLRHGPAKLINNGSWPSSRPFIVIAPQSPSGFYNPDKLRKFIDLIIKNYKTDESRIYLTGLSSGGNSVWNYLGDHQDQVAAAIPIAGKGFSAIRDHGCSFKDVPLWAFHGSNDNTQNANGSIDPVETINACSPNPLAKVTIYSGVGHDSWTRTYDLSGMSSNTDGKYDPYNLSIYDWLLSYSKGGTSPPPPTDENTPPLADAGPDQSMTLPENSTTIAAKCSDPDGNISAHKWEKVNGPSASLNGTSTSSLKVTNMQEGNYEFRLTVTDNDGAKTSDQVKVTVQTEAAPPPPPSSSDCNCDHTITPEKDYINGDWLNIQPGDVICIQAGKYRSLNLFNFQGSAQNPITFINCGGQVIIGDPDWHYGFVMNNNRYFRLTGTGDPNFEYGIKIDNTHSSGLAISTRSSDYEIDHLEISNTGFAGMHLLTSPKCDPSTWRENFTMKNISIHDNYVHDTHGEGFYIGHSKYNGQTITCDGQKITVLPHVIKNIKVFNNTIKNTGWDGFQVSCAIENCDIFNNSVSNTGIEGKNTQSAGIVIGGGTAARLYNNVVTHGNGAGIHVFGLGNTQIFNNVVYDVVGDGIFIGEKSTVKGWAFEIINNTIVKTGRDGIRMYNELSRNNKFFNNLILNPASINDYSNEDKAYIYFLPRIPTENHQIANNYTHKSIDNAKFVNVGNKDFRLQAASPAMDKGRDVSGLGINKDALNVSRPQGGAFDAGAFEFKSGQTNSNKPPIANAGQDLSVIQSVSKVVLKGTDSYDPDGTITTYSWKKISGPSATLSGTNSSQLTVTKLTEGTYNFQLTVTDDDGAKSSDNVEISVKADNTPSGDHGLNYLYYEGSWNSLPDFSSLKAAKSGKISNFSLSPRNRNDNFGFRFDGYIEITKAGEYTFYTSSDDGSTLVINGNEVVNNDGLHGNRERSGKISLSAGHHSIRVRFFEKTGGEVLTVKYAGPGISKQSIPDNKLYFQNPSSGGGSTTPPAPSPTPGEQGLTYKYYEGSWNSLPDFSKLTPVKTGIIDYFDLSPRKRNDNFAFVFEGYIEITKAGEYRFISVSDDGTKLYIDNKLVINNDGVHAKNWESGTVYLSTGLHAIKECYFEKNGEEHLVVKYEGPGIEKQFIPKNRLFTSNSTNARIGNSNLSKTKEALTVINPNEAFDNTSTFNINNVYPNPIGERIHIRFSGDFNEEEISYKLLNYLGVEYKINAVNVQFGSGELTLDVSYLNLSAGIYILQIKNGLDIKSFRLIKE